MGVLKKLITPESSAQSGCLHFWVVSCSGQNLVPSRLHVQEQFLGFFVMEKPHVQDQKLGFFCG